MCGSDADGPKWVWHSFTFPGNLKYQMNIWGKYSCMGQKKKRRQQRDKNKGRNMYGYEHMRMHVYMSVYVYLSEVGYCQGWASEGLFLDLLSVLFSFMD